MTPRNRIQMHFDVATDDQAAELRAAWEEIVSGRRTRISTAAEDALEIMERARSGLRTIVKAIEDIPGRDKRSDWSGFWRASTTAKNIPFT